MYMHIELIQLTLELLVTTSLDRFLGKDCAERYKLILKTTLFKNTK